MNLTRDEFCERERKREIDRERRKKKSSWRQLNRTVDVVTDERQRDERAHSRTYAHAGARAKCERQPCQRVSKARVRVLFLSLLVRIYTCV